VIGRRAALDMVEAQAFPGADDLRHATTSRLADRCFRNKGTGYFSTRSSPFTAPETGSLWTPNGGPRLGGEFF